MNRRAVTNVALIILVLAGAATLRVAGVSAMPAPAGIELAGGQPAQTAPTAVAPGTYSGTVTSNSSIHGLTIHGNDGDRTVVVQPGAAISRNGKTVAVSDLKTGDDVTMTVAQNGVVQSINATSKKSSGFNPLWLLLLLLLLIPLLLWLLRRRKQRDAFVMERGTTGPRMQGTPQATRDDFTVEKDRDPNQRPRM